MTSYLLTIAISCQIIKKALSIKKGFIIHRFYPVYQQGKKLDKFKILLIVLEKLITIKEIV